MTKTAVSLSGGTDALEKQKPQQVLVNTSEQLATNEGLAHLVIYIFFYDTVFHRIVLLSFTSREVIKIAKEPTYNKESPCFHANFQCTEAMSVWTVHCRAV